MSQSARLEVQRRVLFQSGTRQDLIFRNHQRANNVLSCRKWQSLTPLTISRTKTQARTVPQREKQQRPGAKGSLGHTCGGPSSQPFKVVITWLISPAELVADVNYSQGVVCLTSHWERWSDQMCSVLTVMTPPGRQLGRLNTTGAQWRGKESKGYI